MNGIITHSTVDNPLIDIDCLEQSSIDDILPPRVADRYKIALLRAVTDHEHQWCGYSIQGVNFIALIEFIKAEECFSVHEAQISKLSTAYIENLRLRLFAMSGQYYKLFKKNNGTSEEG